MSALDAAERSALDGYGLDEGQLEQLARILDALESDEHAPTTVRERHEAADAHLADSLVALQVDELRGATSIADLGAGAGFPGTALAVALPDAQVYVVESQRRKCEFLRALCEHARIANAEVVHERAEEWAGGIGRNDAVVARALAPQPVVLEYAAPLLRVGGTLVDWRGRRDGAAETTADAAAKALGLHRREIRRVQPFAGARDRHLHVFEKVAATPQRFPRRAGMARKRPLGG